MNGPHDLGGQMGFGPVAPEANEPYFHAEWERRALGVVLSCGAFGAWTIDESRHARENIPPPAYLAASYYEIWIRALDSLVDEASIELIVTVHGWVLLYSRTVLRSRFREVRTDGRAERTDGLANRRWAPFTFLDVDIDQLRIDDLALRLVLLRQRHQPSRIGLVVDDRTRIDRRLPGLTRS